MSPVTHLQYGWWFAHWGSFSRVERAVIALAGAAPDLDGITFVGGQDLYYRTHHILLHNVGATLGVVLLAAIAFWRRPRVAGFIIFAYAMHMVEDYFTAAWNMHPWQPFSAAAVNLSNHLPNWVVQGVFQVAGMVFALGITVWIYIRHRRTPLEILSPALDRLVVNYVVLPWRRHCASCGARAHFLCDACGAACCAAHAKHAPGLAVRCASCAAK